jgi:hypothetical protein
MLCAWGSRDKSSGNKEFEWGENSIDFLSARHFSASPPPENIIESWNYGESDNPLPGNENIRINCWLFDGTAPSNHEDVEVIISGFEFIPNPGLIPVDDMTITRVDPHVLLSWNDIPGATGYNIYANSGPDIVPNPASFLAYVTTNFYLDPDVLSHNGPSARFYCVTAIYDQ